MKLSPTLTGLRTYPFVRLEEAKARLRADGVDFIDFGIGEPREDTPAFIREALVAALEPLSTYPSALGLAELREAIAGWAAGRFGVALDPDAQVAADDGLEGGHLPHGRRCSAGATSRCRRPAYPVYERGALFAGKEVLELPLREDAGFLPDLGAVPARTWSEVGLLWLNYPNNPTGATAPLALFEEAAALAREHGFVVGSDEAYSEIYFGAEPPVSALQLARPDRRRRVQHALQALLDARLPVRASWPATPS